MIKLTKTLAAIHYGFPRRIVAVGALLAVMAGTICAVAQATNAVRIVDGEDSLIAYTTKTDVDQILESQGITTTVYDHISYSPALGGGYAELTINRAYPVTLTADGATRRLMITEGDVDDLLMDQGIVMGAEDMLNLPLNQVLEGGDKVVLQRVERYLVEEEESIPFEMTTKSTSVLPMGRTRVLQTGTEGIKGLTYSEMTIDGQVQERTLLAEDTIRKPTQQVTLVGDGSAISNLDYSDRWPLDPNGIPIGYKTVYRNQVATGYSARYGARGAGIYSSARNKEDVGFCQPGAVAVRTSQFPYGTKLYIRSADGSFIYGYSVANDTGTGLVQNIIDVDLYYDTYLESALNGRRTLDIYVLE